jgi:hypothetical protein
MKRQGLFVAILSPLICCMTTNSHAQQTVTNFCPYANHLNSLACLVPDLTRTGTSNLAAINTTLAQVVGQLPLAVPVSGFILGIDAKTGVPVDINQNLGSVLTERGSTLGKRKLFLGFTYQHFVFQTIDGRKLNDLPTVFFDANSGLYGSDTASLSANVSQYTAIAAFGLTDRIDISATLPFQRVSIAAGHTLASVTDALGNSRTPTQSDCSSNPQNFPGQCPQSLGGSASGVGDLLLNIKGSIINHERSKLAMGMETRFPTGDAYNLLGSGAYGVRPYIVFSRYVNRLTPHVNVGYQWNGFSVLRINPCFFSSDTNVKKVCQNGSLPTLRLPDDIEYSGGADIGIVKKLSLVVDLVGQHFFNAPQVTRALPASQAGIPGVPLANPQGTASQMSNLNALNSSPTVGIANGNYDVVNLGLGLKWNPVQHLIISGNVLLKLNDNGLRSKYVPLVGISYKF